MKKIIITILIAITVVSGVFCNDPESTTIVLRYTVTGSDIRFRLVEGTSNEGESVDKISFGDISVLNENQSLYSEKVYHFVYSYSMGSQAIFQLQIKSSDLTLDSDPTARIQVEFVNSTDRRTITEWPKQATSKAVATNERYSEDFRIKLTNATGAKLPAGEYRGDVVISLKRD